MADPFKRQMTGYRGPAQRRGRQYARGGQCPCCTTGGSKAEQNRSARTKLARETASYIDQALEGDAAEELQEEIDRVAEEEEANAAMDAEIWADFEADLGANMGPCMECTGAMRPHPRADLRAEEFWQCDRCKGVEGPATSPRWAENWPDEA